MTRARRPLAVCAAIGLAATLSSCSLLSDGSEQEQVPTVNVAAELPVTFTDQARWSVELGTDTRPAAMEEGVAVILPGRTSSSLYRVALLSPNDGDVRWVSDDFENPVSNAVPEVSTTIVDETPWVIVETRVDDNKVKLDMYSPNGTGDRRTPEASTTLTGSDSDTLPRVLVGDEGVVVKQTESPALKEWEQEVEDLNKDYEKAKKEAKDDDEDPPKKPDKPDKPDADALAFDPATGETTEYEGPGTLSTTWAEGHVVTDPSDDSGFGFVVDGETAWEASTARPSNTDRENGGELLQTGPGILLAEWTNSDGDPLLAIHEIRSGEVLAVQQNPDKEKLLESAKSPLVQSDDGKWASWGQFVFGLKGGPSTEVDLHGGRVTAIHQDVLYVENATTELTATAAAASAEEKAERQAVEGDEGSQDDGEDTESAESEEGDSSEDEEPEVLYNGMLDAATGDPLTNAEPDAVPLFVSNASQGVFVLSSDGKTRLYSTPFS